MDVCGQIQMPANLRTKPHTIIYVVVGLLGGMEVMEKQIRTKLMKVSSLLNRSVGLQMTTTAMFMTAI